MTQTATAPIDVETDEHGEILTDAERPAPNIVKHEPPAQTVQQARVDSVAKMLDAAYQRASTLELTPEESAKLLADFPDDEVSTGAAGDKGLLYIEHMSIRRRLLAVFGPGRWALVTRRLWTENYVTSKGDAAVRVYAETVLLIRGCYVGEAIGAGSYFPHNPKQNYSDAAEAGESEALRRCAKKLGVGLQVWNKAWCDAWKKRNANGPRRDEPEQPAAPADPPITEDWVRGIRRDLGRGLLSEELFCQHYGIAAVEMLPQSKAADAKAKIKAGFAEWKAGKERSDLDGVSEEDRKLASEIPF